MQRIVIAGGGYAGSLAAIRLAGRGIPVTLVDAAPGLVDRIRLHQVAAGEDIEPTPYSRLFRGLPVEFVRARVNGIDRAAKVLKTMSGDIPYDTLVYALGSTTEQREGALSLRGPAAAKTIREKVANARRVVVAGGGLSGIETAAELAEAFPQLAVTLVDAGVIGAHLARGAQRHLYEWFAAHGVVLREHSRVVSVERDGVVLQSGEKVASDVTVWCAAFSLSPIAREAGLDVNERGQIVVDGQLRSSDESIYAIGDAAAYVRMSCAAALPMAAHVADVLAGVTTRPFSYAFAGECISLGRNDGIIQLKNPDDSSRDGFLSGRPAAWVKELVCRYVAMSLRLERIGFHYRWPKAA